MWVERMCTPSRSNWLRILYTALNDHSSFCLLVQWLQGELEPTQDGGTTSVKGAHPGVPFKEELSKPNGSQYES